MSESKDEKQTTIGWLGQKAWQGTKAVGSLGLETTKTVGRMFGSDWLEKGDDTNGQNLRKISAAQRYDDVKKFDTAANAVVSHMVKLTDNLECLKGVDVYLGDRTKALTEFYDKNKITPIDALTTPKEANESRDEFSALKEDINRRKQDQEEVGAFCLMNALITARSSAKTNLNKQLQEDIKTVNELTDPPYNEAQKAEIIAVLTNNNQEAFKKLEETMSAEIKKQAFNAETENSRLFLIKYYLAQATAEQKNQLEQSIREEENNSTTITLSAGPLVKPPKNIKDAQMSAIKEFKTLSGRTVTQTADGVYTITIPSRWNILYHKDSQDNTLADLKFLALAIHATGKKTITFTLKGDNEEDIRLIARKAYQAGFETGFKGGTGVRESADDKETKEQKESREGNIRIVINGALWPLLDEVKDGKVTKKGVFSSQQELEQMGRREKDFVHQREGIQARDKWPGAQIKQELIELRNSGAAASQSDPALIITGADASSSEELFSASGTPRSSI